jgi:NTP pyrophosphatase (non-canonical NTP hydrolase)
MDGQRRVAAFLDAHDMHAPPANRALDLASEVGELAKEVNASTGYGESPDAVAVAEDELGDALFCLLALCEETGADADAALETALAKYEDRLASTGDAGSGE